MFSSPFIEERLYFQRINGLYGLNKACSRPLLSRSGCIYFRDLSYYDIYLVLVPFYRGAVVFKRCKHEHVAMARMFSSPFIEERLYLSC